MTTERQSRFTCEKMTACKSRQVTETYKRRRQWKFHDDVISSTRLKRWLHRKEAEDHQHCKVHEQHASLETWLWEWAVNNNQGDVHTRNDGRQRVHWLLLENVRYRREDKRWQHPLLLCSVAAERWTMGAKWWNNSHQMAVTRDNA